MTLLRRGATLDVRHIESSARFDLKPNQFVLVNYLCEDPDFHKYTHIHVATRVPHGGYISGAMIDQVMTQSPL